jgi:transposase
MVFGSVRGRDGRGVFPPVIVVATKAIACELPRRTNQPVSRLSVPDIQAELIESGMVEKISVKTIWRWLKEDALKPWKYAMWIYPRDPQFGAKAGPALDLYGRTFEGRPLESDEFVVCSDEKTSIQARIRCHPTVPGNGRHLSLVEHEYERGGAFAYLAAWDVHRAKLFGRAEPTTGIAPFGRLVEQVMTQEPYRSARSVFWIVDNGSSHRGHASTVRLETAYPNARLIHLPTHASWLNQIEIWFSILQRKVLTPADCESLLQLQDLIIRFQERYQSTARPFKWKFTRSDLADLLQRLSVYDYCTPAKVAA